MSDSRYLAGNGAALLREREIAGRVQSGLERVYRLERVVDVGDFVCGARSGEREALLLRESDGSLEVSLRLPQLAQEAGLDSLCQIIEGVSHFVYVVARSCAARETSQLELELQAEVDKWVVLAASTLAFDEQRSSRLRALLYESVTYEHDAESELGERYRIANQFAHGFVRRLERDYVRRARFDEMRSVLREFFNVGQEGKLRLGRVA